MYTNVTTLLAQIMSSTPCTRMNGEPVGAAFYGREVFNVDGDNELTVMAIPLETADKYKHSHAFDLSTDIVRLRS